MLHPAYEKAAIPLDGCFFGHGGRLLAKEKSPDFRRDLPGFSTIIKRWFRSCDLHTHGLTNSFVCNFLSSSAGFNLCSCFFRLTLAFYFRFWLLWAIHSTA